MMALIYSKATGVSIWLGPDPYKDAPVVLENIKKQLKVSVVYMLWETTSSISTIVLEIFIGIFQTDVPL